MKERVICEEWERRDHRTRCINRWITANYSSSWRRHRGRPTLVVQIMGTRTRVCRRDSFAPNIIYFSLLNICLDDIFTGEIFVRSAERRSRRSKSFSQAAILACGPGLLWRHIWRRYFAPAQLSDQFALMCVHLLQWQLWLSWCIAL